MLLTTKIHCLFLYYAHYRYILTQMLHRLFRVPEILVLGFQILNFEIICSKGNMLGRSKLYMRAHCILKLTTCVSSM